MGKTYKVLHEWFNRKDNLGHEISSWCKRTDDSEVSCIICNKSIHCQSKGFAAITQHAATKVHTENASIKLHSNQLVFKGGSSTENEKNGEKSCVQIVYNKEPVMKAEIIWALKSVQCNMAAGMSDDLKDVFSAMFPGFIAEHFHLGRTKLTYLITEALGPYFKKELLTDMQKSYYTLLFDETTNNAGKKELLLQTRYWSEESQEIVTRHLQTFFLGHATGKVVVVKITDALSTNGVLLKNMLMLGSDGPNVNKTIWSLINSKVVDERQYGLINIGTCCIHIVHNAFWQGLVQFGDTACELLIDIYSFFKKFPSRWQDFEKIQEEKKICQHQFIKHVPNRWLTVGPACERVIEQWPAILEYFNVFLPSNGKSLIQTEKYRRIHNCIRNTDTLVELKFVAESSKLYNHFLEHFQSSEPLIHILATELENLLTRISGRICKADSKIPDKILLEHLRKPSTIDCDMMTRAEINKLKESDQTNIYRKMQRHFMASYNHIISKDVLQKRSLLHDLSCLAKNSLNKTKSVDCIGRIARALPFLEISESSAKDEWRLLQANSTSYNTDVKRIDHFWRQIIYDKTELGILKYPSLCKLIKACLSLSHGNSDVEREFSISRRIMTEEKSLMSERVLNDRLIIKDALKQYANVSKVPITKELLNLACGARKSYECFLEEQRKLKEKKMLIEKEKEEQLNQKKAEEERVNDLKASVDKLEKRLKVVNEEKKELQESTDTLVKEANVRLKQALMIKDKSKQMEGIRLAQGMIEGSIKLREKEREHDNSQTKLNRIVNKRKTNLIDSFFPKKPKQ